MASQSKPGPLTPTEYKALMELWGVPYEAVIDYPNGDAPGSVRPGYCRAYMCFFRDSLMSFPIPSFFLEILAELQLSFTQITPTFWRYVLATFVRAREEGLEFGLAELKQLYTLKRSSGVTGAFLLSPRSGRSIITDIPGKDFYWTDKFFVFKVDPVTVGDFDFSRIPMKWNENVELFGTSKSTPELRGLISTLRRDAAPSKRAHETPDKRVTRASSQIQSPIVRATPLSVVHLGRDVPLDSRASGEVDVEEVAPKVQRRRLILDEESSKGFNVSSSKPLMQDPGEGTSKPVNLPADCRSGSPLAFSYDLRSKLSASQASEQERAKQVVDLEVLLTARATEKVVLEEEKIVLEKEKVVLEKEKVAMEADLESLKVKFRRDAELRERVARRKRRAACRLVAKGYDAALDKVRETIRRRRAESAAEMRLQEVRAKI
ncbi:Uncharacterized protein Rs2_48644 [Raphanus sativus]|nr:Uncharacterized protein Rs2_48644 [Raphanus sativus]